MAESSSTVAIGQPPGKVETINVETSAIATLEHARVTRRQWTLIAITCLLNALFVCSLLCIIVQIYKLATDPDDSTNFASEILTLTSALATLAYIVLHSIFSLKQRIWRHQGLLPSKDKRTSYIAIRFAGTLCMLWLLTGGWNMIIVARQPICLPQVAGTTNWDLGTTCQVDRVGVAFAMIALFASCAMFGMLATVSRPFEAHLLNYKLAPIPPSPITTPNASPRQSHSRSVSITSNRFSRRGMSFSTHRSTHSIMSNTDVDTLDLNSTPAPERSTAPASIRSLGAGIFTSHAQPPPVPAAYATPSRLSSVGVPPPFFQPSLSTAHLPLPPRMSALVSSSGCVPVLIPAQYAASNWRAVHPSAPSPLAIAANRSQSHLPLADPSQRFSYRTRYARSSISLTRPNRLSTSTPVDSVGWSSRSGSTTPDRSRDSNDDAERRAIAGQTAYAALEGTRLPETSATRASGKHSRHASAPDATAGAQMPLKASNTQSQTSIRQGRTLVKSSSANILGNHSEDSNTPTQKDLEPRSHIDDFVTTRRLHSERPPLPAKPVTRSAPSVPRVAQRPASSLVKRGSADASIAALLGPMQKENVPLVYEDVKNKPLPRIAGPAPEKGLVDRGDMYNR